MSTHSTTLHGLLLRARRPQGDRTVDVKSTRSPAGRPQHHPYQRAGSQLPLLSTQGVKASDGGGGSLTSAFRFLGDQPSPSLTPLVRRRRLAFHNFSLWTWETRQLDQV